MEIPEPDSLSPSGSLSAVSNAAGFHVSSSLTEEIRGAVEGREQVDATLLLHSEVPVLRAEGLRKAFGGQIVLDGVDLELPHGAVVLLRGNNGSGKTTLLNILTGNQEPDAGVIHLAANGTESVFAFPRPWWRRIGPRGGFAPEILARQGVGRSWQETRLFSTQSLQANIAAAAPRQKGENPFTAVFCPAAVHRDEAQLRDEADRTLAQLGLVSRGHSLAGRVSLGQSKRVAIARAVGAGARLLYLDEPLAGLDAAGVASVLELLEGLAREHRLTLVIVEHLFNIPRVLDLATTVWTLEEGKLRVEEPEAVRAEIQLHLEEGLQSWIGQVAGPGGSVTHERLPGGAVLTRVRPESVPDGAGEVLLEVEDLVVYRGGRLIVGEEDGTGGVRGLSLSLRRGELSLLQAPNGWGKTTLLEALAGVTPVTRGRIRVRSEPVERRSAWERRQRGLSLLQARNHAFLGLTVREALQLGGVRHTPERLQPLSNRTVADLSGGERQKVAVACALSEGQFQMALLDEPFLALDAPSLRSAWSVLEQHLSQCGLLVAVPASAPGAAN